MTLKKLLSQSDKSSAAREEHWIPLSDLMSGLMMMFMLVAIIFMVKVEAEAKKAEEAALTVKGIALIYDDLRARLYQELQAEFQKDLPVWGADLERDLTIRFKEPNVLFDTGSDVLKPRFVAILNDFFPRYVRILTGPNYKEAIEEIRIEGHTSSVWTGASSGSDAYFRNMALSQSRTRSALQHVLMRPEVSELQDWLRGRLTANGLSSSKLIRRADGSENREGSQRVEFRVRTNAEERMAEILKAAR